MKKLTLFLVALAMLLVACKPEIEKPTVVTKSVGEVTETTAKVVGQVTADGGAEVTERGVCWNTEGTPEVIDYRTVDGKGVGTYESNMTDLKDNTTYYVRAYAINEKGVSYGEELTLTTKKEIELPTVTTAEVKDITETTAVSGGEVTSDGGGEVTARGICWSTSQNPTIEDDKTTNGSGVGSFTSQIPDLVPNTQYYVRAYATNEAGTSYGEEKTFTTLEVIPEEPGDEPEEPGDEPEEPGDEPEEPGDEPEQPGDEPEEPGDEPEEPGDEPEEPGDEPEEPGDEPEEQGESISELIVSFNIYPNPVNDKLNIITEVEIEEVVVYDVYGRQQSMVNGQQSTVIDVSDLNSGVYFVMIKTNEGVVTKRFVKE